MSVFAYAQARLQARYGERIGESTWQALYSLIGLDAWLEQARATTLRRWLVGVTSTSGVHDIERLLRSRLHDIVSEVTAWSPAAWRPAVRWTSVLIDLPAVAGLMEGQAAPGWMLADPRYRSLAVAEPALRSRMLAQGPLAPLAAAASKRELSGAGWRRWWVDEWRRRFPHREPRLERLAGDLEMQSQRMGQSATDAWAVRRELAERTGHLFRRGFMTPAAVFAFLLLQALELERVRAEIVKRALFEAGGR